MSVKLVRDKHSSLFLKINFNMKQLNSIDTETHIIFFKFEVG